MPPKSSQMVPLGTTAPDFTLPDGSGTEHTLAGVQGSKGTLIIFMCNHCPFVVHIAEELARLGQDYPEQGIGIVGISANDVVNYPDDGPDKMVEIAKSWGLSFPYLYDESQEVAKAYGAECTPDFFVFDANHALVYRGQLDASRPDSGTKADGADLRAALDALIDGRPVPPEQVPSIGCGIKWKA